MSWIGESFANGYITPDLRDVFYLVAGVAFFGLTVLPRLRHVPFIAAPPIYIIVGFLLALTPFALPLPDPVTSFMLSVDPLKVVEHVSEIIVIISLTGAGLAIDTALGWRSWMPVWRQLAITMPLTILVLAVLGTGGLGLSVASAVLLAACLAPTDPVLARAVQVGGPTEGKEDPVRLGLTGEAGLNDGFAFPFVYLAIAMVGLSGIDGWSDVLTSTADGWFATWVGFDLIYRVVLACLIGWVLGNLLARFIYSDLGDGGAEPGERGENAGLTMMAATFACYGLTELFSAYGFLAVFASAVAGRSYARGHETRDSYVKHPHQFGEQTESLLMALLLLWIGAVVAGGVLEGWRWSEVGYAFALLFIVRPLAGLLANVGLTRGDGTPVPVMEKAALAFYGVRGLGSVFYLAYGINHAGFADGAVLWRVTILTIVASILIHGFTARPVMQRVGRMAKR